MKKSQSWRAIAVFLVVAVFAGAAADLLSSDETSRPASTEEASALVSEFWGHMAAFAEKQVGEGTGGLAEIDAAVSLMDPAVNADPVGVLECVGPGLVSYGSQLPDGVSYEVETEIEDAVEVRQGLWIVRSTAVVSLVGLGDARSGGALYVGSNGILGRRPGQTGSDCVADNSSPSPGVLDELAEAWAFDQANSPDGGFDLPQTFALESDCDFGRAALDFSSARRACLGNSAVEIEEVPIASISVDGTSGYKVWTMVVASSDVMVTGEDLLEVVIRGNVVGIASDASPAQFSVIVEGREFECSFGQEFRLNLSGFCQRP